MPNPIPRYADPTAEEYSGADGLSGKAPVVMSSLWSRMVMPLRLIWKRRSSFSTPHTKVNLSPNTGGRISGFEDSNIFLGVPELKPL